MGSIGIKEGPDLEEEKAAEKSRSGEGDRSISRLNKEEGSRYLDDLIEEGEDVINCPES